jgi:aspartate carbamoyltransferase catalytic subunit
VVCGPKTLIPKHIKSLGVEVSHNVDETLAWCDVAMVLRIQLERQEVSYFPSLREYRTYFGIDRQRLEKIGKDLVIMHPGPINRGVELSSDVADGPFSIILDQVENGVATRMAGLFHVSEKIRK